MLHNHLTGYSGPDDQFSFEIPGEAAADVQPIVEKPNCRTFREYPALGNTGFIFQLKQE